MTALKTETLNFSYNEDADVITIEEIKYAGDLFRGMALFPVNTKFRIVERCSSGVLTVEQLEPTCAAQSVDGK